MKQTLRLFMVAALAGILTLGGYKLFVESNDVSIISETETPSFIPVNYSNNAMSSAGIDFTEAAEKKQ